MTNLDNEEVPIARRITPVQGADGLIGNKTAHVYVGGEPALFAVDFAHEMVPGQKISAVEPPVILEGTADGLSFVRGKRNSLAKLLISATAADEYVVWVKASWGVGGRDVQIMVKAT